MASSTIVKLEDLEPSIRNEVEQAAKARGRSQWAVVEGDGLKVAETIERLGARIDDLEDRAEKMNEMLRETMRSSACDHGRPDEVLMTAASLLARIREQLGKLA